MIVPLPFLHIKLHLHLRPETLNPLFFKPWTHIKTHAPHTLLSVLEILLKVLFERGARGRVGPAGDAAVGVGESGVARGGWRGGEELDQGADEIASGRASDGVEGMAGYRVLFGGHCGSWRSCEWLVGGLRRFWEMEGILDEGLIALPGLLLIGVVMWKRGVVNFGWRG
jgi:hypothetical protein